MKDALKPVINDDNDRGARCTDAGVSAGMEEMCDVGGTAGRGAMPHPPLTVRSLSSISQA
jgi:hypothetical protein